MLKEHPFLVTTTFQGDGDTIKYDITKPNRSDAVGKAFKINANGIGELVEDGDEIDGKVISVDDDHKFTGAYMFGGLTLPLGDGETVIRGDKLVGALGASNAKGHVKAVTEPTALANIAAADFDTAGEELVVHNAARTQITNIVNARKGKGSVLEFDTSEALVAFGP